MASEIERNVIAPHAVPLEVPAVVLVEEAPVASPPAEIGVRAVADGPDQWKAWRGNTWLIVRGRTRAEAMRDAERHGFEGVDMLVRAGGMARPAAPAPAGAVTP